jgi:hypothetical protein
MCYFHLSKKREDQVRVKLTSSKHASTPFAWINVLVSSPYSNKMATTNLNTPTHWKPLNSFQYNSIQVASWQRNAPLVMHTAERCYFQEYAVHCDHENIHTHSSVRKCYLRIIVWLCACSVFKRTHNLNFSLTLQHLNKSHWMEKQLN